MVKTHSPKVVVIGAGSLYFGRQAIWQMVHSPILNKGTLALVDKDPVNLRRMSRLAEMVARDNKVELKIEADTDRQRALEGADYVVLSFADRSVYFRGLDCVISEKYGIRMCSGDTIGPGGVFRTLREFPQILACCRDIASICPEAWVINYINPTAANGIGLRIFAPELKTFALCDGLHMPRIKRMYAKRAGIINSDNEYTSEVERDFDFRIAGPNHFTWLLKAEFRGEDVRGKIAETLRREAAAETDGGDSGAKSAFNKSIGYSLYQAFGYVPTCVGHTKEYVRFWQGLNKTPEDAPPLFLWNTDDRYRRHQEMWSQVDAFLLGITPIGEYMDKLGPDHATDIIEAMEGKLEKPFFINTANQGTVPNLPDDAFLEMLCDLTPDGPRPRAVGNAPVGLRGLWQQVLDAHELSARAAVTCDRDLLLQALVCDPMVSSLADARALRDELLELERDALPAKWFNQG